MRSINTNVLFFGLMTAFITLLGLFILNWPTEGLLFFYWLETGLLFLVAIIRIILFALFGNSTIRKKILMLIYIAPLPFFFLGVMLLHSLVLDHFFGVDMTQIHTHGLLAGLEKLIEVYNVKYGLILIVAAYLFKCIWSAIYDPVDDSVEVFTRRMVLGSMKRLVLFHILVFSSVFLFSAVFENPGELLYLFLVALKIYIEVKLPQKRHSKQQIV